MADTTCRERTIWTTESDLDISTAAFEEPEPIRVAHDEDAGLFAVSTAPEASGWLVFRVDTPQPEAVEQEQFYCPSANWDIAGHPSWLVENGRFLVIIPGRSSPYVIDSANPGEGREFVAGWASL